MRTRRYEPLPAGVEALRNRIERWRRTRKRRAPMPGRLWDRAIELAASGGVCRIARAVHVDCGALKARVEKSRASTKKSAPAGFVSLEPGMMSSMNHGDVVVEISDDDGAKLTVRLTGRVDLDVLSLTNAFWRRRG